jgi:hypothetical protein
VIYYDPISHISDVKFWGREKEIGEEERSLGRTILFGYIIPLLTTWFHTHDSNSHSTYSPRSPYTKAVNDLMKHAYVELEVIGVMPVSDMTTPPPAREAGCSKSL